MTIRDSNIHIDNVSLCKMYQRTRFNHISNFSRLVVAVVVRKLKKKSVEKYVKTKSLRLRFCQNPCFEKSLRLRFDVIFHNIFAYRIL